MDLEYHIIKIAREKVLCDYSLQSAVEFIQECTSLSEDVCIKVIKGEYVLQIEDMQGTCVSRDYVQDPPPLWDDISIDELEKFF